MGFSYFITLLREIEKVKIVPVKSPHIPSVELSPRTKEKMRKVKSEEDFMKVQVPWIL